MGKYDLRDLDRGHDCQCQIVCVSITADLLGFSHSTQKSVEIGE